MIDEFEAVRISDFALQPFDVLTQELHHVTGLEADHVVVMPRGVQFENRMTALEIVAPHQASFLELGEHPVNRRQADVLVGLHEVPVDILRAQMAIVGLVQDIENLEPRPGGAQASLF